MSRRPRVVAFLGALALGLVLGLGTISCSGARSILRGQSPDDAVEDGYDADPPHVEPKVNAKLGTLLSGSGHLV
jgi:hypothetical protein